jgi:DNA-binding response OmpR family regulator
MKVPFAGSRKANETSAWALGIGKPVRVLLVDDDRDEASLTKSLLARAQDVVYEMDWVPTFREGVAAIARDEHDAYLIDHQLGIRTGVELVQEARDAGSRAALIMLTGQRDRQTDLAAMKAGASDFLLKGHTDAALLDRTLRYAVTQAAVVSALERSREQLDGLEELGRILVDNGPTPAAMARVVDLIADRFELPRVAIYMADGETLTLAGQRGYAHPVERLSRGDSSVERVVSARTPIFVPSLSSDTGDGPTRAAVATELSVPLFVAGELAGLLNVASLVAAPIGDEAYAGIRIVADRLTAALASVRETRLADDRLRAARRQPSGPPSLLDPESAAYGRDLLEPLLDIALASAGADPGRAMTLLLVGCEDRSGAAGVLGDVAMTVFAGRPRVRFAGTAIAVLLVSSGETSPEAQARDLLMRAAQRGLSAWCGYAASTPGMNVAELIRAAEAALGSAEREGAGAVIG